MKQQYPTFPTTIGKKGSMTSPEGDVDNFTIVDEVLKIQSNAPHKMICFQKISFEDGSFEFRLAYYIIGIKSKMKGKWIFGQFATLVSQEDLRVIIREAQQKKWF